MGLTFGSVCSGIEAASVAWHPLGWRAQWLAEVDRAASEVLDFRFPDTPNHGDMLLLAGMVRRREIPAPDILVGGTPCQAFSVAGRRQGLDDARGQLTIAFIDLADAIDEVRCTDGKDPVIIVWENVPGVLTVKGNAFGCFLAGLAGESDELKPAGRKWTHAGCVLGPERAIAWRTLDAQYFGLAQRRRRVFVVASARQGFDPTTILFECEGVRRDSPPSREAGQGVAGAVGTRAPGGGFLGGRSGQSAGGVAFGGGNCSGPISTATALNANERYDFDSETFIVEPIPINLNAVGPGFIGVVHGTQDPCHSDSVAFALGRNSGGENAVIGFSSKDYGQDAAEDISPTLRAGTHSDSHANGGAPPAVAYAIQERAVCENPQAGPDGAGFRADDCSYTLEARHIPQAVAYMPARTFAADGEVDTRYAERPICDALHTSSGHGNKAPIVAFQQNSRDEVRLMGGDGQISGSLAAEPGSRGTTTFLAAEMAVRRLMPVECERLQGFPDNWTLVPTGAKQKPAADGPRYKQLGNSMAVNCMNWIGRRIAAYLAAREPPNDDFDSLIGDEFDALLT